MLQRAPTRVGVTGRRAGGNQQMLRELIVDRVVSPIFEGKSFGSVGQYEMLYGRARGELDPADRHNTGIVNLDKGPRNESGKVEYSMEVIILKPIDMSKGNGLLYFDVLNRGDKKATGPVMNGGPYGNDPHTYADGGNGFLLDRGYTVVWSAWQADVPPGNHRMLADFPAATNGDEPYVATCRNEFIYEADYPHTGRILLHRDDPQDMTFAESQKIFREEHATFNWVLGYAAADLDPAKARLTIRHRQDSARETPPDLTWRYVDETMIEINRPSGYDQGALYEFIFPAKNPTIMGIGFASIRDLVSFLRFDRADAAGKANPLLVDGRNPIDKAVAVAFSQGARALRDFMYGGFNLDEAHRHVFEGFFPIIGGARKGHINVQFAYPNLGSRAHETHLINGDGFPFSYTTTTDPISGRTDGVLYKYEGTGFVPRVMHLDTETEFWQARSSLIAYDGEKAVPPSDNVRLYLVAGTQHSPAFPPMPGTCKYPPNNLENAPFVRALFVAFEDWVVNGVEPPESRFPSVVNGTLVPPDPRTYAFPRIGGVRYTGQVNPYRMTDHTKAPPVESGPEYPIWMNRLDADGNGVAGIRHPFLEAPLGTHVGWNLREAGHAEDQLAAMEGAFFPFAKTRAEREANGDPRLSLEERYPSHEAYVAIVTAAARRLMQERLLLEKDAARIIEDAKKNNVGR